MMKFLLVLSAVVLIASAELYSPDNDNLNIEGVVGDIEELEKWSGCFLDKASCDERMTDFKKDIREAVVESCAKCTDAQKHIFKRYLEELKVKIPSDFQTFKQKYDPEDKYIASLESAIASS